jgi:hypothetical protein
VQIKSIKETPPIKRRGDEKQKSLPCFQGRLFSELVLRKYPGTFPLSHTASKYSIDDEVLDFRVVDWNGYCHLLNHRECIHSFSLHNKKARLVS